MRQISQQLGVGLVEVLVAVLLLSVAVLGFSALQLRAISATDESLVRTQAMSILRGLAENMRANPSELDTYEDTINDADSSTTAVDSCQAFTDSCTSEDIAIKESTNAVAKLNEYGINIEIVTCPGTANFSEVKCIIAAWGDTQASMDSDAKDCANENGIYKSGSTCVIVEAY